MATIANKFTSAIVSTRNVNVNKSTLGNNVINNSKILLVNKPVLTARVLPNYVIELMNNQGSGGAVPIQGLVWPRKK